MARTSSTNSLVTARRITLLGTAILAAALLTGIGVADGAPANPCDRVLYYFTRDSERLEWRILNPNSRADALFLVLSGSPAAIFWDSSLSRVTFQIANTIYQADWRLGAREKVVMRLPEHLDVCSWWFNSDSSRWQALTKWEVVKVRTPRDSVFMAYRSELWQSSRDGMRWHRVLVDTSDGGMEDCGISMKNLPRIRHEPVVSSTDLAQSLTDLQTDEEVPVDSVAHDSNIDRYFAPSATVANRGYEFDSAWTDIEGSLRPPIYLIDRERGTRQPLCKLATPEEDRATPATATEACGAVLIYCGFDPPRLVDIATGQDIPIPRSTSFYRGSMGFVMDWAPSLRQ